MKKNLVLTVLILIFLLTGCSTLKNTKPERKEFTNYEARHAMEVAMAESHRATTNLFYKYLETQEQFIPEKYQILVENKDKIVGISEILENWRKSVFSQSLDMITKLHPTVEQWIDSLMYANPTDFVNSSNTSGTESFRRNYEESLRQLIKNELSNLDLQLLNQAVDYYNANAKVKAFENNSNAVLLEQAKPDDLASVAENITDVFFELFATSEELFRTTPNLYVNSVVAKVFGLE